MMKVGRKYTHTHFASCTPAFWFLRFPIVYYILFVLHKINLNIAEQAKEAGKAAARIKTACFPFCHEIFISFCCVVYACFFPIIFLLVCYVFICCCYEKALKRIFFC